jgi:hypothetical protein
VSAAAADEAHEASLERNRDRIRRIVDGQCFDPGTFDETQDVYVGVGEKLLFTGRVRGKKLFVVDSPDYGHALYVFGEEEEDAARDWANQNITWTQARDQAIARIVHIGDWQGRLQEALA